MAARPACVSAFVVQPSAAVAYAAFSHIPISSRAQRGNNGGDRWA
jgi:hypothetical protein